MASVQELIAAAEAQKSPFVSMLEGFAGGYLNESRNRTARKAALDVAMKEAEIARLKQESAFQKMANDAFEKQLNEGKSNIGFDESGPLPSQKMDFKFRTGRGGAYLTEVTPKQANMQKTQYVDPSGQRKLGAFDPKTGKHIQSKDDPLAPMPAPKVGQSSKSAANNTRARNIALDWYGEKYPDKVRETLVDGIPRKVVTSIEDEQSDEFQNYYKTALEMLTQGPKPPTAKPSVDKKVESTVERKLTNGKIGIFDSKTKKFLRYK